MAWPRKNGGLGTNGIRDMRCGAARLPTTMAAKLIRIFKPRRLPRRVIPRFLSPAVCREVIWTLISIPLPSLSGECSPGGTSVEMQSSIPFLVGSSLVGLRATYPDHRRLALQPVGCTGSPLPG